jgi:hypothetical protein
MGKTMARNDLSRTNGPLSIFDSAAIPATLLTVSVLSPALGVAVALTLSALGASAAVTFPIAFAAGSLAPLLLATRFGRIY